MRLALALELELELELLGLGLLELAPQCMCLRQCRARCHCYPITSPTKGLKGSKGKAGSPKGCCLVLYRGHFLTRNFLQQSITHSRSSHIRF